MGGGRRPVAGMRGQGRLDECGRSGAAGPGHGAGPGLHPGIPGRQLVRRSGDGGRLAMVSAAAACAGGAGRGGAGPATVAGVAACGCMAEPAVAAAVLPDEPAADRRMAGGGGNRGVRAVHRVGDAGRRDGGVHALDADARSGVSAVLRRSLANRGADRAAQTDQCGADRRGAWPGVPGAHRAGGAVVGNGCLGWRGGSGVQGAHAALADAGSLGGVGLRDAVPVASDRGLSPADCQSWPWRMGASGAWGLGDAAAEPVRRRSLGLAAVAAGVARLAAGDSRLAGGVDRALPAVPGAALCLCRRRGGRWDLRRIRRGRASLPRLFASSLGQPGGVGRGARPRVNVAAHGWRRLSVRPRPHGPDCPDQCLAERPGGGFRLSDQARGRFLAAPGVHAAGTDPRS